MLTHLPQSMYVKAFLVSLFVIPILAAYLGSGPESAKAASRPGLTYGGMTSQDENVFLRKSRNRRQLARFVVDWMAAPTRCTNGKEYFGFSLLDPSFSGRIAIRRGGRFTKRDVWRDTDSDGSVSEDLTLAGRFRGKRAAGRFRVFVTERNPAGAVINRCDTGSVRWSAVD